VPRLKILFAVPECFPFAKTGGLGDVSGALPVALAARGHDVRVVMPRYRVTRKHESKLLAGPLGIPFGAGTLWAGVRRTQLANRQGATVPVYLLDYEELFDRSGIYGDESGGYGDNTKRYSVLSRGALELCRYLGFDPDVIHVHDWPTCLLPVLLDTVEAGTRLGCAASVLSIHNMAYQGWAARSAYGELGVPWDPQVFSGLELHGQLNLLKAGIVHSTIVSTVSPNYAREIQTREGGEGLDALLRMRGGDVVGVLNGIDEEAWNPELDPHIAAPFSAGDLSGKAICKAALQREMGLPERSDVPLVGLVSRLVAQKGVDLVVDALGELIATGAQFVFLGSGDGSIESVFQHASHATSNVRAFIGMNEGLAHRIEAGADLFLMPSRYEPCGLNQMYSQRYGTLPIVRAVGGLEDTVENGSTGFKFEELSKEALVATVRWALATWARPEVFRAMQVRAMQKPMGWSHAAQQYEALYRFAVRKRRRSLGQVPGVRL
jgi:starch synthase